MNIVRNKHFFEYEIAERQLVMKDNEEKSWFNLIKTYLEVYNLPSIFFLFDKQMPKTDWKKTLTQTVSSHIEVIWLL